MDKKRVKKIATWIIVPLMVSFFLLDIMTVVIGNIYAGRVEITQEKFDGANGDDRIHFLNTANSDCILIESNGKFAMIDSGEGDENPRRKMPYQGYSQRVIDYVKKVAGDGESARLEFILGTHYHYDHVGSFDKIINDPSISIGTAYFKEYDPKMGSEMEAYDWGLLDCYKTIIADLEKNGIPLVSDIPEHMTFGDFELTLYNTVNSPDLKGRGENSESIGIKVEKGEKSAFLAADITKKSGLEKKLGSKIGHIDLLKVGHHGYYGSSSMSFLDCLTPSIAIVPNQQGKVYPNVKWNLTMHAKIPFFGTYDYNGIIASFTDDGKIKLTDNIHG